MKVEATPSESEAKYDVEPAETEKVTIEVKAEVQKEMPSPAIDKKEDII